jgi:hypothetical protein
MPNAIKYKTGNLTGSISTGNVALGVNESVLGPTETTGWYSGLTPSPSQYVIYEVAESGVPKIYQPSDDTQLIQFARSKGATGANTGSVASVLNWAATQNSLMIVNNAYPSIVTDGLVLNVDAGFIPSYPTTGSTWYDLSGNGNNGSSINGARLDNDNLGSISFDGVNETVNISGPASRYFPILNFTLECTFKTTQTTRNGLFSLSYGIILRQNNGILQLRLDNGGSIPTFSPPISSPNVNNGSWYTVNIVVNGGNNATIDFYINGEHYGQRSTSWSGSTRWPTNSVGLGRDNNDTSASRYNGNIARFQIYNRALTAEEIFQNYNATKGRYGI